MKRIISEKSQQREELREQALTRNECRVRMALRRAQNNRAEIALRPNTSRDTVVCVVTSEDHILPLTKDPSRVFRPHGKDHYFVKDHYYYHRENHPLATVPKDRLHLLLNSRIITSDMRCAKNINNTLISKATEEEKAHRDRNESVRKRFHRR